MMRDRSHGPLGLGVVNIVVVVAGGLTEMLQATALERSVRRHR